MIKDPGRYVDRQSVTKHQNLVIAGFDTAILLLVALSLSSRMDINYLSRDRRLIDFTMHVSNAVTLQLTESAVWILELGVLLTRPVSDGGYLWTEFNFASRLSSIDIHVTTTRNISTYTYRPI